MTDKQERMSCCCCCCRCVLECHPWLVGHRLPRKPSKTNQCWPEAGRNSQPSSFPRYLPSMIFIFPDLRQSRARGYSCSVYTTTCQLIASRSWPSRPSEISSCQPVGLSATATPFCVSHLRYPSIGPHSASRPLKLCGLRWQSSTRTYRRRS